MIELIVFGFTAYILGSIPSAVWIGKAWHDIDVREHGSKNSGATNTFRVLGKKAGVTVLLMDVIKGLLAVFLPFILVQFLPNILVGIKDLSLLKVICALTAILGHIFPVFAQFNGGKGVATSLGVIIAIHPPTALFCFLLFLAVFLTSNFVSLGAITASVAFPLVLIFGFKSQSLWLNIFSVLLGAAVIFAHKKNIKRLLKGEENKMKLFKK
ncbi:MAG: glycerol-3-phosphate 1-O-acyltransferase PlsY [Crocinitomicaceae bacterium]